MSSAIQNPIHYEQHEGRVTAPGGPGPFSVGTPAVDDVAHKDVGGVRGLAADPKQLEQIVQLRVVL